MPLFKIDTAGTGSGKVTSRSLVEVGFLLRWIYTSVHPAAKWMWLNVASVRVAWNCEMPSECNLEIMGDY